MLHTKFRGNRSNGFGEEDFLRVFMPPTLKKWGAYCFRLVRPFVRPFVHPFVRPFKKNLKLGF